MNPTMKERFSVTLESAGSDDIPAIYKLRGFLKSALRVHGLRAVTVNTVPSTPKEPPSRPIDVDEAWCNDVSSCLENV